MGVIRRGNSKFWYIQFQFDGRTYIKSSKTTEKRLAELMESDWRKQLIHQKIIGVKDRVTMQDALSMYCQSKCGIASYKNIVHYAEVLNGAFQTTRFLDEILSQDLERLRLSFQNAGYSNQTIKHFIGAVRGAWKYAKRMGYQANELEFPNIKTDKGRLRYLSFDEEKKLLKSLDPRRAVKGLPPYEDRPEVTKREMQDLYDFIVLLLDTGARYNEIAKLEWSQVNLGERTIALWRPKVRNESVLFMTERVFDILTRRNEEKENLHVFVNRNGQPRGYIASTMTRAFRRAGLPDCSAHTLRHTHAARLIQNGLSIYEVKEILGHSDIRTTMRYAHIEQRTVTAKAREVIDRLNKENNRPDLRLVL